ncbi:hypothetical protein ACXYMX_00345 [Sporosarcina sp. CAU 1771]
MNTFKHELGDVFLIKDFKVAVHTLEKQHFIQSKNYVRGLGLITGRYIAEDDGCEYYQVKMEDGYELTVGKYFLSDCMRVLR